MEIIKRKISEINKENIYSITFKNKNNYSVKGNTNTVYINPFNSLKFVLNKLIKDKVKIKTDFYVFTGSTVGVAPITCKGLYKGIIEKLGTVSTKIL